VSLARLHGELCIPDLFAGTKKEKHHTSYEVQCFFGGE